jgi:type I site-specific deoxyribonuclease restriction subunit
MEVMLKEIGEIITGNTPSKNIKEFWDSNDICFIKPDIIADFVLNEIYVSNEYISECARKRARIVSKGAVFVTCIGSIGKIGIAGEGEYAFNQQINAIVPNSKINPRYLAYNLLFNKQRLIAVSNAPVVPIINKSQFGEFVVNIEQDISKQSRIVYILDKLSLIINNRKEELNQLDIIIKARFVEMFGSIYDNEYGYNIKTLQDVCEQIKDGTHQTPTYTEDKGKGFKFLSSKDVVSGKIDWSRVKYISAELHEELYSRIKPKRGDLLLAKNGTTGVAAIVETDEVFDIYVSLAILRPVNINSVYLWGAVNSMESKRQFDESLKGIGVPNLHLGEIKKTKIVVPPIQIQDAFEQFVLQIDKSKVEVQRAIDEAQLLFDSLIQKYFG